MTRHDDEIRRMLREGDPAREHELAPVDRARMRAAIVSAAAQRVPRRSVAPLLVMGAAMATVVAALLLLVPQAERHGVIPPPPPKAEVAPEPVVSPSPLEPVVVKRAVRARPARPRPRPAVLEERASTTRIMFTGPEGTRILWFVGTPDAKELGS